MYTFTEDCLIGIEEIDEEHKTLFKLIGDLDMAVRGGENYLADAMMAINTLKQYVAIHFTHEEEYMESIHDPELPRQQKEHKDFAEKVASYRLSELSEESSKEVLLELVEYLSRWLMSHILGSDILIGQFQNEQKPAVPVFTERFKTGIDLIDEEHKTLFDTIGHIHEAIESELVHDKYDAIMGIINELKEYTQVHFSDEEKYMREIGYEGLEKQEILHQKFIDKLGELDLTDVDDNQEAYLYDFLEFLQTWLVNHILKVDKQIPKK